MVALGHGKFGPIVVADPRESFRIKKMLSSHSGRRKLTFYCSKIAIKKSFICPKVNKFELN